MPIPTIKSYDEQKMHFLTFTVIEWIDIFTNKFYFESLINSMKFCRENKNLQIFGYVLMTNHVHVLWKVEEGELSSVVQSFKRYITKELKKLIRSDSRSYIKMLIENSFYKKRKNKFQVWQENNYPEVIESEKFFQQKLNYIHNNPVKKGYVWKAEDWVYSSARNYSVRNDDSVLKIDMYD